MSAQATEARDVRAEVDELPLNRNLAQIADLVLVHGTRDPGDPDHIDGEEPHKRTRERLGEARPRHVHQIVPRPAEVLTGVTQKTLSNYTNHLANTPLDAAFTLRRFQERLRRRRGRLKTTLTDQSFIAGVGNIYADESLWRARLHPLRSADSLNTDQERRLYEAIRDVLTHAIRRGGYPDQLPPRRGPFPLANARSGLRAD